MKPDGIAKGTNCPFWHIARMPAPSILSRAKLQEDSQLSSNDWLGFCTGAKIFEQDKKLSLMTTWFDPKTKKYKYVWTATFKFKKSGITVFINRNAIECKSGKQFANSTYSLAYLDEIYKIITPRFHGMRASVGRIQRKNSAYKKTIQLIYDKAKKEGTVIGKLLKKDLKKMDIRSVLYCFGSEFLCNQVHYGLKNNPSIDHIELSPYVNLKDKTSKKIHKRFKTNSSIERLVKYAWGRGGKNLIKVNNAYLFHTSEKTRLKVTRTKTDVNGVTYNIPVVEEKKVPVMIIDTQMLLWGKRFSKYINIDSLMPAMSALRDELLGQSKEGVKCPLVLTGNNRLMDKSLDEQLDAFLMQFSEQKRTQLLSAFFIEMHNNRKVLDLVDAIEQWYPYRDKIKIPKDLKTTRAIHDYIATERRKLGVADFQLTIDEKVLELDGLEIENMRLEIPRTNHKLIEYGQKMNNCIGDYGQRVNVSKKAQWLMGVYKDGELTYNIEINQKQVIQFWGKHNSTADEKDQIAVLKALKEKGLITEHQHDPSISHILRGMERDLLG
jgi:hypothetical protein